MNRLFQTPSLIMDFSKQRHRALECGEGEAGRENVKFLCVLASGTEKPGTTAFWNFLQEGAEIERMLQQN
jgi:hypothetical protein